MNTNRSEKLSPACKLPPVRMIVLSTGWAVHPFWEAGTVMLFAISSGIWMVIPVIGELPMELTTVRFPLPPTNERYGATVCWGR